MQNFPKQALGKNMQGEQSKARSWQPMEGLKMNVHRTLGGYDALYILHVSHESFRVSRCAGEISATSQESLYDVNTRAFFVGASFR